MKLLVPIALCALAGCADFEHGFVESYNRVHASDYVADYSAPEPQAYTAPVPQPPPLQPIQSGTIMTPGQPLSFYNYNPNTGCGTIMTPGQQPTFISGH